MFNKESHLSAIATQAPRSIPVLKKYGLDFCCGGNRPIADACSEKHLSTDQILGEIEAATTSTTERRSERSWEGAPLSELVSHILEEFHEKHRRDVALLIPLAQKVEAVHSGHPEVPRGLTELLKVAALELQEHMMKEENVLFPWILHNSHVPPYAPVKVMMEEHLSHKERLAQLRQHCRDFVLPEEACSSWRALYKGVEQLIGDIMEHIHLESNILFPRAISSSAARQN